MKILLIKIGAAGDVLRTTALLPGILDRYPESSIDWLTESAHRELLTGNPNIRGIYCVESLPYNFRKIRYDLIVNIDEEPDICHLASQLNAKKIIGTYLRDGLIYYTPSSRLRFDMSRISRLGIAAADRLKRRNRKTYQQMCYEMLNIPYKPHRPYISINPADRTFAAQFAKTHNINPTDMVIGISSSAGVRWPNKRLSIPETVRLIRLLRKRHQTSKILLLGGPSEAVRNSEIHSRCPEAINTGSHHSYKRFAALVGLCSVLVTSDSFPLHIGAALGKRIVAFFGPTSPWEIDLYGNGVKVLPKQGCVACFRPKCIVPLKFDIPAIAKAV